MLDSRFRGNDVVWVAGTTRSARALLVQRDIRGNDIVLFRSQKLVSVFLAHFISQFHVDFKLFSGHIFWHSTFLAGQEAATF